MTTNTKSSIALEVVNQLFRMRRFMPVSEMMALRDAGNGEEGEYFAKLLTDLADRIETMPKTYEQDGKGQDAIAYLHYFNGGMDWYITEKDIGDGSNDDHQYQAFGLAAIGYEPELGYISIQELIDNDVELDLYFDPKPLRELHAR